MKIGIRGGICPRASRAGGDDDDDDADALLPSCRPGGRLSRLQSCAKLEKQRSLKLRLIKTSIMVSTTETTGPA